MPSFGRIVDVSQFWMVSSFHLLMNVAGRMYRSAGSHMLVYPVDIFDASSGTFATCTTTNANTIVVGDLTGTCTSTGSDDGTSSIVLDDFIAETMFDLRSNAQTDGDTVTPVCVYKLTEVDPVLNVHESLLCALVRYEGENGHSSDLSFRMKIYIYEQNNYQDK
jgi:hypothetical protein